MRDPCAPRPILRGQQHGTQYRKALDKEGLDECVKTADHASSDRALAGASWGLVLPAPPSPDRLGQEHPNRLARLL